MEGCAIPAGSDMDELIVKGYISRMLSDNTTLIIIFFVVILILGIMLWYFVSQAYTSYKEYKNNVEKSGEQSSTYEAKEEIDDPAKFQEPSKLKFIKSIDAAYKEYNMEKTNYIKTTYGKENDDYIDKNIVYSKYDDYSYKSKDTGK